MSLGAFSISLAVRDLAASREFYEKLGFTAVGGDSAQNWLIMRSGEATIGLFQGMFEGNILTFNPGWDAHGQDLPGEFDDVRAIGTRLRASGLEPVEATEDAADGPGHIMLVDPDGNSILIDQHR